MPTYIIRLVDEGAPYYLEWYGMRVVEFVATYLDMPRFSPRAALGQDEIKDLQCRLDRAELFGTSSVNESLEELLASNRAGQGESHISREQLIKKYIRQRPPGATRC